jgi:hypothetical protein
MRGGRFDSLTAGFLSFLLRFGGPRLGLGLDLAHISLPVACAVTFLFFFFYMFPVFFFFTFLYKRSGVWRVVGWLLIQRCDAMRCDARARARLSVGGSWSLVSQSVPTCGGGGVYRARATRDGGIIRQQGRNWKPPLLGLFLYGCRHGHETRPFFVLR